MEPLASIAPLWFRKDKEHRGSAYSTSHKRLGLIRKHHVSQKQSCQTCSASAVLEWKSSGGTFWLQCIYIPPSAEQKHRKHLSLLFALWDEQQGGSHQGWSPVDEVNISHVTPRRWECFGCEWSCGQSAGEAALFTPCNWTPSTFLPTLTFLLLLLLLPLRNTTAATPSTKLKQYSRGPPPLSPPPFVCEVCSWSLRNGLVFALHNMNPTRVAAAAAAAGYL